MSSSSTPGAGANSTAEERCLSDGCCNEEPPSSENNIHLNRDDESGVGRVLERSYLPVLSKYHTNKATTHNLDKDTSSLLPLPNLLF